MPDSTSRGKTVLTDKIDELESLLSDQTRQPATSGTPPSEPRYNLPILDDLFIPDEEEDFVDLDDEEEIEPEQRLEQIADDLEVKLSQELDEIVSLLKTNMKESILSELQSLLKNESRKKADS